MRLIASGKCTEVYWQGYGVAIRRRSRWASGGPLPLRRAPDGAVSWQRALKKAFLAVSGARADILCKRHVIVEHATGPA